jgi:hypothetical protein
MVEPVILVNKPLYRFLPSTSNSTLRIGKLEDFFIKKFIIIYYKYTMILFLIFRRNDQIDYVLLVSKGGFPV